MVIPIRQDGVAFREIQVAGQPMRPHAAPCVEQKVEDDVVLQTVFRSEIAKLVAVEPTEAVIGGNPEVAVVVLQQLINFGAGQPV